MIAARLPMLSPDLPRSGQRVGRYTILAPRGVGSTGAVFAAYDDELERCVAIKILRRSVTDVPRLREQLRREGRALARLAHPAVVTVHDVGVFCDQLYLVMELVDGGTLRTWLADGGRHWTEIVRMALGLARGLQAIHAVGLLHRDVKPDNILVDRTDRAFLADFGLAERPLYRPEPRIVPAEDTGGVVTSTTASRLLIGTPAYMAFELLTGGPASAHSDQFAFCVTVFEALYGVRPFTGSRIEDLAARIAAGQITPTANADIPAAVHAAVVRGLAASPADRHASMSELIVALEHAALHPPRWRFAFLVGAAGLALRALFASWP